MRKFATLATVAALGAVGPFAALAPASAAEHGLEWREVTGDTDVQLDRRCWQTQHVWDAPAALKDVPCTPVAQFPDGTWVSFYVADTVEPAEQNLEWRPVTSSNGVPLDRLCWQTQHVWDTQGIRDVPCTPRTQLPSGEWVSYYLADTSKVA